MDELKDKIQSSAEVMFEYYKRNTEFRGAVKASILSALSEMHGSHSDVEVAERIADRLFSS